MTTAEPGHLSDDQASELVQLRTAARASGDWSVFAAAVTARRAAGVTVTRIAAAVGISESRVRQVCRQHGHEPPAVRVPGWVSGHEAAAVLGVSAVRLAAAWRSGEAAGVTRTVGWDRLWRLEELAGWWSEQPAGRSDAARARRAERAEQVRELAAGGAGLDEIAREVGVSTATARRARRPG